jgi:hypothetical protein
MPKPSFADVWNRVVSHAGETFATKTGLPFTYKVAGDAFFPSRTNYRISRADFEAAYLEVPFDGPGVINATVRGPAYVWAVLHDARIRLGDW